MNLAGFVSPTSPTRPYIMAQLALFLPDRYQYEFLPLPAGMQYETRSMQLCTISTEFRAVTHLLYKPTSEILWLWSFELFWFRTRPRRYERTRRFPYRSSSIDSSFPFSHRSNCSPIDVKVAVGGPHFPPSLFPAIFRQSSTIHLLPVLLSVLP
jgi:hypothetical protein